MSYYPLSTAAFVYQDAVFTEIEAHDNGYIYGRLPPGHVHEGKWVRLARERNCSEWRQRRLIAAWIGDSPTEPEKT